MPNPDFTDTSPWDPRTRSADRDLTTEFEILGQNLPENRQPNGSSESRFSSKSSSLGNVNSTARACNQLTRTFDSKLEGESYLDGDNDFNDFYLGKEVEFTYQGSTRQLTLFSLLGQGGMGEVYEARSSDGDGLMAAIKFVRKTTDAEKLHARFNLETSIMQSLDHPNIVQFYGQGQFDHGQTFIAMELLETSNIVQYCKETALNPKGKLNLFAKLCQAVAECHENGIIHRDIKPTNVLIQKTNQQILPKLIDFGVAKIQQAGETGSLDQRGQMDDDHLVGTVQYMSPEQVSRHHAVVDERTDIYSLGILLFELVTGNPPISGHQLARESLDTLFERISNAPTPSLREFELPQEMDDQLAESLDAVFRRSITPSVEDRYQTADELKTDIMAILADPAVPFSPPDSNTMPVTLGQRNRGRGISNLVVKPFWQTISLSLLVLLFLSLGNNLAKIQESSKHLISGPTDPQQQVDSTVCQTLLDPVNPGQGLSRQEIKQHEIADSPGLATRSYQVSNIQQRSPTRRRFTVKIKPNPNPRILLSQPKKMTWSATKGNHPLVLSTRDLQKQVQHHAIQQFLQMVNQLEESSPGPVSGLIRRIPRQTLKRCLDPLGPLDNGLLTGDSPVSHR